jgi:hypothetical protein
VRLSVKKAAFADLARAACRKSGAVLGRHESQDQSRKGRLRISQDASPGLSRIRHQTYTLTRTLQPDGQTGSAAASRCKPVTYALAYIANNAGEKTGNTRTTFAPDARIDNTQRAKLEQLHRQLLRSHN